MFDLLLNSLSVRGIRGGEAISLVQDYLDSCDSPSVGGLISYKAEQDSENASQIKWDALSDSSISTRSAAFTGEGFAGYMNNLRKTS